MSGPRSRSTTSKKNGSEGNRTRTSRSVTRNSDHLTIEAVYEIEVEVTLLPTVSRPVHLGVVPLLEQVTKCYIYLSDNYFLYCSRRAPSLTRGRVCNLQCNDASSISSYNATDGLVNLGAGPPMRPITRF
jgi:hypothetical protein